MANATIKETCRVCGKTPGKEYRGTGLCGNHQNYYEQQQLAQEERDRFNEYREELKKAHQHFLEINNFNEETAEEIDKAIKTGLATQQEMHDGIQQAISEGYSYETYVDARSSESHEDTLKSMNIASRMKLTNDNLYEIGDSSYADGLDRIRHFNERLNELNVDIHSLDISPNNVKELEIYDFRRPTQQDLLSYAKENKELCENVLKEKNSEVTLKDMFKSPSLWEEMVRNKEISESFIAHMLNKTAE